MVLSAALLLIVVDVSIDGAIMAGSGAAVEWAEISGSGLVLV